jgi:hypothetical protein
VVDDRADQQAEGAQPRARLDDVVVGAPRVSSRLCAAEGASVDFGVRDGVSEVLEERHEQGVLRGRQLDPASRNDYHAMRIIAPHHQTRQ